MHVLPPHPPSLLFQKCAPTLQILVVNTPPPLLAVSIQGRGGPPPPPSAVRAYAPLLSDSLPQIFDPPLKPSNVPAPLPHISALPLEYLDLNTPPLPSVLLQGRGGLHLLPSVAHDHAPLLHALRLRQGVPPLITLNVPAPLAQLAAFPLQRGGRCLQTSAVNPPPTISALLLQRDLLPLQISSVCATAAPPLLSVLIQVQGGPPTTP